jgi:hypothetical protein
MKPHYYISNIPRYVSSSMAALNLSLIGKQANKCPNSSSGPDWERKNRGRSGGRGIITRGGYEWMGTAAGKPIRKPINLKTPAYHTWKKKERKRGFMDRSVLYSVVELICWWSSFSGSCLLLARHCVEIDLPETMISVDTNEQIGFVPVCWTGKGGLKPNQLNDSRNLFSFSTKQVPLTLTQNVLKGLIKMEKTTTRPPNRSRIIRPIQ